jgi:hypothetical protein
MHNRHPWPERRVSNGPAIIGILLIALGVSYAASVLSSKADPTPMSIDQTFAVSGR